jgi:hypothetical protein
LHRLFLDEPLNAITPPAAITTSTAIAAIASGEPRSSSEPPSAVYANARGAAPSAVAAAKTASGIVVSPAP